jgi:hypothetical protein
MVSNVIEIEITDDPTNCELIDSTIAIATAAQQLA